MGLDCVLQHGAVCTSRQVGPKRATAGNAGDAYLDQVHQCGRIEYLSKPLGFSGFLFILPNPIQPRDT